MKMVIHAIHLPVEVSERTLEIMRAVVSALAPYAIVATVLLARQA